MTLTPFTSSIHRLSTLVEVVTLNQCLLWVIRSKFKPEYLCLLVRLTQRLPRKKQGAYGKVVTHKESKLKQLVRIDEVMAAVTLMYIQPLKLDKIIDLSMSPWCIPCVVSLCLIQGPVNYHILQSLYKSMLITVSLLQ